MLLISQYIRTPYQLIYMVITGYETLLLAKQDIFSNYQDLTAPLSIVGGTTTLIEMFLVNTIFYSNQIDPCQGLKGINNKINFCISLKFLR